MGKGFGFGSCSRTGLGALLLAAGLLASTGQPASADWRLYASGDLGYSVSKGSAKGEVEIGPIFPLEGDDIDVSPLLGGAVGLAVPMDEIAPVELPWGWRLPHWDVRAEIEAVGLREYRYSTKPIVAGEGKVQTKLETWSVLSNFYLDVPLRGLYRPVSWTSARLFGRWRLRTLKLILDRTTLYGTLGLGVANIQSQTQESSTRGTADEYNFAWQGGGGLGYRLTDRVVLGLGYRYLDVGTPEYRLTGGGVPQDSDSFIKIDPQIHEVRGSVRVEFWDFPMPWR